MSRFYKSLYFNVRSKWIYSTIKTADTVNMLELGKYSGWRVLTLFNDKFVINGGLQYDSINRIVFDQLIHDVPYLTDLGEGTGNISYYNYRSKVFAHTKLNLLKDRIDVLFLDGIKLTDIIIPSNIDVKSALMATMAESIIKYDNKY